MKLRHLNQLNKGNLYWLHFSLQIVVNVNKEKRDSNQVIFIKEIGKASFLNKLVTNFNNPCSLLD